MPEKVEKNVCPECISDPFVQQWIKDEGIAASCDYCNQERVCVILSDLADWVDKVYRENYQLGDEYPVFDHGEEKPRWEMAGSDPIDIIGNMLGAEEGVAEDLVTILSDQESYAVHRDGETPYYDCSLSYEETPVHDFQHSELWDDFCFSVKHRSRFFSHESMKLLSELIGGLAQLPYSGKQAPIREIGPEDADRYVYRARRAESKAARLRVCVLPVRELGSPPARRSIAGRMNPAGIPAFYGALDRETCLVELRLSVGDVGVTGKFEIIRPLCFMDLTVFAHIYEELSLFDPSFKTKASRLKFLRRFEREISKPILPGDEVLEYAPTQALVEYLANYYEPRIDGIIYSSTQTGGKGKNVVIFRHAAHILPIDPPPATDGRGLKMREMWTEMEYLAYPAADNQDGTWVSLEPREEGGAGGNGEPAIRLVEDSLEVHQISAIQVNYSSNAVSVETEEETNTEF